MKSYSKQMRDTQGNSAPVAVVQSQAIRFQVFKNATFLGESAFTQNHIAIGSSPDADLVLDHQAVAAFHAFVYLNNGQIFLSNKYPENGLRLNGNSVKEAEIYPENIIDIGPFSLHIDTNEADQVGHAQQQPAAPCDPVSEPDSKPASEPEVSSSPDPAPTAASAAAAQYQASLQSEPSPSSLQAHYTVVLLNHYGSGDERCNAAQRLARLVHADEAAIAAVLKKPTLVIKRELDHQEAQRWQATLQAAGLACFIQEDSPDRPAAEDDGVVSRIYDQEQAAGPVRSAAPEKVTGWSTENALPLAGTPEALTRTAPAGQENPGRETAFVEVAPDQLLSQEGPAESVTDTAHVMAAEPAAEHNDLLLEENSSLERYDLLLEEDPALEPQDILLEEEPAAQREDLLSEEALSVVSRPLGAGDDDPPMPAATPAEVVTAADAIEWDPALSDDDVEDQFRPDGIPSTSSDISAAVPSDQAQHLEPATCQPTQSTPLVADAHGVPGYGAWEDEDEEDEDEEGIWEAPFSLREHLDQTAPRSEASAQGQANASTQVHVIKTISGAVMDAEVVKPGRRYVIRTGDGNFILADNKSSKKAHVYFNEQLGGYTLAKGQIQADLSSFRTDDYLHRRKKGIYRLPLDQESVVVVEDGECQYRVFRTFEAPELQIDLGEKPVQRPLNWKPWMASAVTHAILILLMTIFGYMQTNPVDPPPPHFVKIDTAMLDQLKAKKVVVPPKPPEPKHEPVAVVEKVVQPQKKALPKPKPKPAPKVVAKKAKPPKTTASANKPSRHPDAGGGFGKGNIKNRNVNQTGLLNLLSKTDLAGPSEAMAAVTNLDAVAVPGATEKNFTVGGIKGSLGDGKISVTPTSAGGGLMQTKGGAQVLRSAGAKGDGQVAALERGATGNRKVQAMVSAKLTRTVKIEGGMSREMVKRVIDQHLDDITYCYESALMNNPSIMGRAVFEWKILMSGKVGEIRIVASSINSNEVHHCIKSAISSWQFPKPLGSEVVVSFPFVFDLVAF